MEALFSLLRTLSLNELLNYFDACVAPLHNQFVLVAREHRVQLLSCEGLRILGEGEHQLDLLGIALLELHSAGKARKGLEYLSPSTELHVVHHVGKCLNEREFALSRHIIRLLGKGLLHLA